MDLAAFLLDRGTALAGTALAASVDIMKHADPTLYASLGVGAGVGAVMLVYFHLNPGEPADYTVNLNKPWEPWNEKDEAKYQREHGAAGAGSSDSVGAAKKSDSDVANGGGSTDGGDTSSSSLRRRKNKKGKKAAGKGNGEATAARGDDPDSMNNSNSASAADDNDDDDDGDEKKRALRETQERIAALKARLAGMGTEDDHKRRLVAALEKSARLQSNGGCCQEYAHFFLRLCDWGILVALIVALLYFVQRDYGVNIAGGIRDLFPREAEVIQRFMHPEKPGHVPGQ